MTEPEPNSRHLNVLPHSGKVDQMRKEIAAAPFPAAPSPVNLNDDSLSSAQLEIKRKVIDAIRTVYDPEIPVNVYELGLIYAVDLAPDNSVSVKMTLTAPACPVAGTLPGEVERRIETVDGVPRAKVEIVWDPPWTRERMSEAALLELGLL